jgi:hypothetical protein
MPNKKSYKPTKTTPAAPDKNLKELAADEEELEDVGAEGFEEDAALVDNTAMVDQENYEGLIDEDTDWEEDLATGALIDTQHGQGHTYNPTEAWDQGLTYTPPDDPPVLPGDNPQGVEIAAGFAPSMAQSNPDEEELPPGVDNNDDDLAEDIYVTLRNTSETSTLADAIIIAVEDGLVTLTGTVETEADIALVYEVVSAVEGVVDIEIDLQTEP